MKVIPYTTSTGVQIGLRYNETPKPMPIDDPDMETIQSLFICSKEWHRQRNMERLVYGASVCMALTIMILYLMVSK
jgi:hypothetical protein